MKRRKEKPYIIKYIFISFIIFCVAVTISIITRAVLVSDNQMFLFSDEQAGLVTSMIEGAVSAIAAAFVLYQLKVSDGVEARQNEIEEASFILQYNQAFIRDPNMCEVEHRMEMQMEGSLNDGPLINEENRQIFINYLVYLEGLAPLVFKGVLQLEHIDDLMAYRFFLAVNNEELQKDQLFTYPDYYRGCFKLYHLWKKYRKQNHYPILQEETSLDKWADYEKYIDCNVTVNKLEINDNLEKAAALIYETDPYIYPAAFGRKRKACKNLKLWMRSEKGLFGIENIYAAKKDGKIVGIAVVTDNPESAGEAIDIDMNLPESYADVAKNYFNKIPKMLLVEKGLVYVACICVSKKNRGESIGAMLVKKVVKKWGSQKIVLDVLADNQAAIELYEKYGFVKQGEAEEGYSYQLPSPKCYTMIRYPRDI